MSSQTVVNISSNNSQIFTSQFNDRVMDKAQPRLTIVEQPQKTGYRFRYGSEGATHGGIQGDNTKKSKKTYPCIQVHNFRGNIKVIVQLVATDSQSILHPHELVGRHCKYGFYVQDFPANDKMTFQLQNLSILHVTKKEVPKLLAKRIEDDKEFKSEILRSSGFLYEPPWNQEIDENTAKSMAMNVVKLKISVYLMDNDNRRILLPNPLLVFTQDVFDSKCTTASTLKICRIDKKEGCCTGGDEIFLLCEKVKRDDIEIRFYEIGPDEKVIWEDFGKFGAQDVHRQFAIVFRTPAYRDTNIARDVTVRMELRRKIDREVSPYIEFVYVPERSEMDSIARKRAKRLPSSLNPRSAVVPHHPDNSKNFADGRINCSGGEFLNFPDSTSKQNSGPTNSWFFPNIDTIIPDNIEQTWSPGPNEEIRLDDIDRLLSDYMSSGESTAGEDSGVDFSITPQESPLLDITSDEVSEDFDISKPYSTTNLKNDDLETDAAPASPLPIQNEKNFKREWLSICSRQLEILKEFPTSNGYETALYVAVLCGQSYIPTITLLIKMGEKISIKDKRKNTPLHIAVRLGYSVKFIRILLKAQDIGDCINSLNIDGQSPLHLAVINNDLSVARALIDEGAHPNIEDSKSGRTPLYLAVNYQHYDMVKMLLDNVDDVDYPDGSGYTPLGIAVINNDFKSAYMLIEAGADPNALQDDGLPIILTNHSDKMISILNKKLSLADLSLEKTGESSVDLTELCFQNIKVSIV